MSSLAQELMGPQQQQQVDMASVLQQRPQRPQEDWYNRNIAPFLPLDPRPLAEGAWDAGKELYGGVKGILEGAYQPGRQSAQDADLAGSVGGAGAELGLGANAGLLAGGARPDPSLVKALIGPASRLWKKADYQAYKDAYKLAAEGRSPEEILNLTGMQYVPDTGQVGRYLDTADWTFKQAPIEKDIRPEIFDKAVESAVKGAAKLSHLGDVIDAPELFAHHPELSRVPSVFVRSNPSPYSPDKGLSGLAMAGSMPGDTRIINMGMGAMAPDLDTLRRVGSHEITHMTDNLNYPFINDNSRFPAAWARHVGSSASERSARMSDWAPFDEVFQRSGVYADVDQWKSPSKRYQRTLDGLRDELQNRDDLLKGLD